MQRLVIVNYGSGNLHSAAKAFERAARESEANVAIAVSADPGDALAADRVVLPGVGAFADCRAGLYGVPGMVDTLPTAAKASKPCPACARRWRRACAKKADPSSVSALELS